MLSFKKITSIRQFWMQLLRLEGKILSFVWRQACFESIGPPGYYLFSISFVIFCLNLLSNMWRLYCSYAKWYTGRPRNMRSFLLQFLECAIENRPFLGTYPLIFSHSCSFYFRIYSNLLHMKRRPLYSYKPISFVLPVFRWLFLEQ